MEIVVWLTLHTAITHTCWVMRFKTGSRWALSYSRRINCGIWFTQYCRQLLFTISRAWRLETFVLITFSSTKTDKSRWLQLIHGQGNRLTTPRVSSRNKSLICRQRRSRIISLEKYKKVLISNWLKPSPSVLLPLMQRLYLSPNPYTARTSSSYMKNFKASSASFRRKNTVNYLHSLFKACVK